MTMQSSGNIEISVGVVDDLLLFRELLVSAINSYSNFRVTLSVGNGAELVSELGSTEPPDVLLLDLSMPRMNGLETARWLRTHRPHIRVLVLTMYEIEADMLSLLRLGVRGFVKKDIHPSDLRRVIETIMQADNYYYYAGKTAANITEHERRFLELVGTEYTYKEIAKAMGDISPRTVDNYRDSLFLKLNVRSRVGLALYALKNGLITFD